VAFQGLVLLDRPHQRRKPIQKAAAMLLALVMLGPTLEWAQITLVGLTLVWPTKVLQL
jgi:hypothetical protein